MDIGRIKNRFAIRVVMLLPIRVKMWTLHAATCAMGLAMRDGKAHPVMDPYNITIGDVIKGHLDALERKAVSIDWLANNARECVGADIIQQNEAAQMDALLTFLQQNHETKQYFETNN